jgi:hypothetical protein
MKEIRIILYLSVTALVLISSCNHKERSKSQTNSPNTDTAVIFFSEYEHDFGKVAEGEKIAWTFTFENKGNGPLIISSVTTSCGCTVAKYETKPVAKDNTGMVEIVFDSSGKSGRQTKTINVNSNASKPVVLLRITGEVISSNNN